MSRHLYDLIRMIDQDTGRKALEEQELYIAIIRHRENYSRLSWVDYTSLQRDQINFVPADELMEAYRSDYKTMIEQMIYGTSPKFEELILRLSRK